MNDSWISHSSIESLPGMGQKKQTGNHDLSSTSGSVWSVKVTSEKPMALERWNVQKKQIEMDNSLMEYYDKQIEACKVSEHNLNKKAETLYNKIFMEIKWSFPPIAGIHSSLILEYCRHLVTKGSYQPFAKEMDLRSWNVKVKGTLQEKGIEKIKGLYTRLFRLISRRDNMITSANNTLMLSSEKMKIRNEGSLRWMMEHNQGKKDEYFSIWNLSRTNKLRELQVLFSSANKMRDYGEDGVNCVDPDFCLTALHYAAKEAHLDIVQFLLQKGADVKIAAPDGRTPLHYAAAYGNRDIVLALLGAGSIASAVDKNGSSPLDLARQNQNLRTLPTLEHWEELMDFKGDGDDDAILLSLEASANLHDPLQGLNETGQSTILQVDSVDKLPAATTRSFILENSANQRYDQSLAYSPISPSFSQWKEDTQLQSMATPWEFATVSSADYQKMSRDLQFLVQRLNGFNPFLVKRQQQLFEQQQQIWQSQHENPNYQQTLYMSESNWPAVTSNMMQTHSFVWNSSMVSLPYNTNLHAGSQSILAANFPQEHGFMSNENFKESGVNQSYSMVDGNNRGSGPEIQMRSPTTFNRDGAIPNLKSMQEQQRQDQKQYQHDMFVASMQHHMQPEERIIPPAQKNHFASQQNHTHLGQQSQPYSAEDEAQRKIDQELQAMGITYAGSVVNNKSVVHESNTGYNDQFDREEMKYKYLTEIRLCTKYFMQCTKEGFVAEAVRILHRRWTVAKKLYDIVARKASSFAPSPQQQEQQQRQNSSSMPVNLNSPFSSPHKGKKEKQDRVVFQSPESPKEGSTSSPFSPFSPVSPSHSHQQDNHESTEIHRLVNNPIRAYHEKQPLVDGDNDDDAASAVSAMTADFDEDIDGMRAMSPAVHDPDPSQPAVPVASPTTKPQKTEEEVRKAMEQYELQYNGSRKPVHLEKLASDFLQNFTIIEYLPGTPPPVAVNQTQDNNNGMVPQDHLDTTSLDETDPNFPVVHRMSDKIFMEAENESKGEEKRKDGISDEMRNDGQSKAAKEKGLVVDSESVKQLAPNEIIQKLLQRYANEEHRVRLMEYAWRYENQELLDHYTVHSSTAAASNSLSSAYSADRRYRERLAQKFPHGYTGNDPQRLHGFGGAIGPQPAIPVPGISQVQPMDAYGHTTHIQPGNSLCGAGGSVVSHLTAPTLSDAHHTRQKFQYPHAGFVSASQLAQHRSATNIGMATNLMGDENSTIVSLTSWDLSIQRHYQQHPPPVYFPENNYMVPFFPLTDLEKYAENYVLMLGMEFVEVLLVEKEYDQALLCLEDCLRLHDGVLITMRIRVIFQLCDLILYLCDSCWDVDNNDQYDQQDNHHQDGLETGEGGMDDDEDEDNNEDDIEQSDKYGENEETMDGKKYGNYNINVSNSKVHKKGEAAFSPYASSVIPPSFGLSSSVVHSDINVKSKKTQKSRKDPSLLSASTSVLQLPPLKASGAKSKSTDNNNLESLQSKSLPNTPKSNHQNSNKKRSDSTPKRNKSASAASSTATEESTTNENKLAQSSVVMTDEMLAAKWLEKILSSPSSLSKKKASKKSAVSSKSNQSAGASATHGPPAFDTSMNTTDYSRGSNKERKSKSVSSIHLTALSTEAANANRLPGLPTVGEKIHRSYITGPPKRRRKRHVLQLQQLQWPQKLANIEEQWDKIRQLPSLSVRDTLQVSSPHNQQYSNKHAQKSTTSRTPNVAHVHDRLYRKFLQRCLTIAQEAMDLGSVLSTRHVFEPLFIAQAMGYLGLAQERLGDIQEAWEMLEQGSLVAARVAYASATTIDLMLNSLRVFVKYQCRNEQHLTWVSRKAGEINQMISLYTPLPLETQADAWYRKCAEWLAIATMTVRDPYYNIAGHEHAQVSLQAKSLHETSRTTSRKVRYL